MNADNPVNKDGSNILIDVSLSAHIEAVRLRLLLGGLHVLLDLLAVQADVVYIG